MNHHYYVYIATNKRHTVLYTGVTNSIAGRLSQHKNKLNSKWSFSNKYNIEELMHYELFFSVTDAIAREKQIKSWSRKRKIDLINKNNPDWNDLFKDMDQ